MYYLFLWCSTDYLYIKIRGVKPIAGLNESSSNSRTKSPSERQLVANITILANITIGSKYYDGRGEQFSVFSRDGNFRRPLHHSCAADNLEHLRLCRRLRGTWGLRRVSVGQNTGKLYAGYLYKYRICEYKICEYKIYKYRIRKCRIWSSQQDVFY